MQVAVKLYTHVLPRMLTSQCWKWCSRLSLKDCQSDILLHLEKERYWVLRFLQTSKMLPDLWPRWCAQRPSAYAHRFWDRWQPIWWIVRECPRMCKSTLFFVFWIWTQCSYLRLCEKRSLSLLNFCLRMSGLYWFPQSYQYSRLQHSKDSLCILYSQ